LTGDTVRYERNPDFIFRKIVDEAVLVPIHRDVADMECIYTLSEVGALIWQELDAPATEAELQKAILDQYEASPEAVAVDLDRFLRGMVEIGAIRRV
jgi:hypothetical protein